MGILCRIFGHKWDYIGPLPFHPNPHLDLYPKICVEARPVVKICGRCKIQEQDK